MNRVIKLNLSAESIDAAIREVEQFQQWIQEKTKELLNALAQQGYEICSYHFSLAAYDGTNDVQCSFEERGENVVAVVAVGHATLFIEFGTGIMFPDDHPEAAENNMIRGEYGKKQGANPNGWYYRGDPGTYGEVDKNGKVHTYGSPANMCMYLAIRDVERMFEETARRVFSG